MEQQRSQQNKTNLKQQRRVAEPIQASGNTPNHRGASSQLAALTLMSTPVPVEPPDPQINRGTRASRAKRQTKSQHISETCSDPLKSSQNRLHGIQTTLRSPSITYRAAAEGARKSFPDSSIPLRLLPLLAVERERDQDVSDRKRNVLPAPAEKADGAGVNPIVAEKTPQDFTRFGIQGKYVAL